MSGFPRWIRTDLNTDVRARSTAALWKSLQAAVLSMPKPSVVAPVVLPDERKYPLGSLGRLARISRVGGTGGEHDSRR
jgi:hypothetical protein